MEDFPLKLIWLVNIQKTTNIETKRYQVGNEICYQAGGW